MIRSWLIAVLAAAVVSACTTVPVNTPVDPSERKARLQALSEFSFNGGLGIWTDEQSISARVQWQQREDKLAVSLAGPFGIGDMRLEDASGTATLSRAGNIIASGQSVDDVLQTGLGLAAPVPVGQLKSWVRGLPGEGTSLIHDEQGKLSSLRYVDGQGTGWKVQFLRYSNLDGLDVPAVIRATGGLYSVRLLLKNWQSSVHSAVPAEKPANTRLAIPSR